MPTEMPPYLYQGARAMVLLHEEHLAEFLVIWRRARAAGIKLPETSDPDYASLETILRHVLACARGYMTWMCEKLELDDPQIDPPPPPERVAEEADAYLKHIAERWRSPLCEVPEERFGVPEYRSRWDVLYCIDAMLEHAVMHPIRHGFQLRNLIEAKPRA